MCYQQSLLSASKDLGNATKGMFCNRKQPKPVKKPSDRIKPYLFVFGLPLWTANVRGSAILFSTSSNELPVVQSLT